MAKYTYKFIAAELWGNARDGFDSNDFHTLRIVTSYKPLSDRWLTKLARDCFEGSSFAWSENRTGYMSRVAIELESMGCSMQALIHYRGHYIGEVLMTVD